MTTCNAGEQVKTETAPDQGMEQYIGTKTIHARPCTADEAEKILGRKVCRDNADAEGNGYLVQYKDGYTSWSPALAFDEAYRKCNGMTFGMAIEALKVGKKVARVGWNGKGMYLAMQSGSMITPEMARGGVAKCMAKDGVEKIKIGPHVGIKTPGNEAWAWNASQQDLFAEDWMVVD